MGIAAPMTRVAWRFAIGPSDCLAPATLCMPHESWTHAIASGHTPVAVLQQRSALLPRLASSWFDG
jgi:hypothetical protein